MADPRIGERFSQVYLERGAPARDSKRFRNRLALYVSSVVPYNFQQMLGQVMGRTLGIEVPSVGEAYIPSEVFKQGELRDVLDSITLLYRLCLQRLAGQLAADWLEHVARAMTEENVGYRVDEQGGVHYYVDQEFEQNRAATVAVLQHHKLAGALAAHEDAYRHLDGGDTKAAVRSIFETVEIIARLVCPETKNLNRWLAENTLKQKCLAVMPADPTEQRVASGMFDSLAEWVDGLHNYRHGQGVPEPVDPSEQLAVFALSSGSAYARTIAACHLLIGNAV